MNKKKPSNISPTKESKYLMLLEIVAVIRQVCCSLICVSARAIIGNSKKWFNVFNGVVYVCASLGFMVYAQL